jgi:hypothetical protein
MFVLLNFNAIINFYKKKIDFNKKMIKVNPVKDIFAQHSIKTSHNETSY